MKEKDILQEISKYDFYHIIQLTDNIATPGSTNHVPAQNLFMEHIRSLDLKGKRVLDIGCRDGLFSFMAESMGAEEVIGIDNDLSKPATEFLIPYFNSQIKMFEMNVYDIKPDSFGLFDVVLFPGVLYHLRYPFWSLRVIRNVLKIGGHLLIETAIWEGERNNAMLFCPVGDESPYEITSCTFFNEKGLVDTLKSIGFEIVATEQLKRDSLRIIKDIAKRFLYFIKNDIKKYLSLKHRSPISIITRGVFHSIYRGNDEDSFLYQYWEDIHDIH